MTLTDLYREGRWQELVNYQCVNCPFATLDYAALLDHIQRYLPPPQAPRPVAVPLFDRFGNPLPTTYQEPTGTPAPSTGTPAPSETPVPETSTATPPSPDGSGDAPATPAPSASVAPPSDLLPSGE